ncbi:MAG TPA: prolyl oligopeptidase family serine peptidase [Mycobacteriales bacterium]|nr:prolyl oligopeptidase family serine peptidase [Mycobacteriales bacterium]
MSGPAAAGPAVPSPAGGASVAGTALSRDAVQLLGEHLYWVEGRPTGDVLVRGGDSGAGATEALPPGVSVASRVHEYGGGAYLAHSDGVWFVRAEDQQIWRSTRSGLHPVTVAPPRGEHRYADLRLVGDGLLVAVRERHGGGAVTNELVMVPADGSAAPWPVAGGWDFCSFPRPSPDGRVLAWTTWRHPLMPWDGTWLWVAQIGADGTPGEPRPVAGGPEESVFQPEWSPGGVLHYVSDRSGWWDLYACPPGGRDAVPLVHVESAELGTAQWELGYSTYAFLSDGRIALLAQQGGATRLYLREAAGGGLRPVELPYTSIKPYLTAAGGRAALIGSTPARSPIVAVVDLDRGGLRELTTPTGTATGRPAPEPEVIDIPARDGSRVPATLYHPQPDAVPGSAPPPVVVRAHPGPTANTPLRLDPWVAFFVSQGFAVLDVDYRGSTGYGRAYRNALRSRWGLLDVSDCVDAVTAVGRLGIVDPTRAVISGASAGGYTALRAATTTEAFRAATIRSAIVDPGTWRATAPKFQAHHADLLLGPAEVWQERSVLRPGVKAHCPILALHGEQDTITPPSQAHALATALGDQVSLVVYPHEGHGLSHPENINHAAHTELAHYRAALSR